MSGFKIEPHNTEQFFNVFDRLSSMDAKKDLINTKLDETYGVIRQIVELVKSFFSDQTKLSYNNINLIRVSENIKQFVEVCRVNLKTQADNAFIRTDHPFNAMVKNIEILRDRYVAKHASEAGIEDCVIVKNLGAAIDQLKAMKPA